MDEKKLKDMMLDDDMLDSVSGGMGGRTKVVTCPNCGGSGRANGAKCPKCEGKGVIEKNI